MAEAVVGITADELRARIAGVADRSVPALRRLRRAVSRDVEGAPGTDVLALGLALLDDDEVPRWWAYELIHHHPDAMRALDLPVLERLGDGLASWGDVDSFACYLSGPAWREGDVRDEAIHAWTRSPDRWWRRAAVVSTVALNTRARGGRGDAPRTLAVCALVLDDRDDMVVKALSWALRALAVREPGPVRSFLEEHGSRVAARVRREVRNKLETGLKSPPR